MIGTHDAARDVLDVVRRIPRGCVATYGDVARRAGLERRARLVGRVLAGCDRSVPWHRVVAAGGRITAPAAAEQARRLRNEGVSVVRHRVDLRRHRWLPDWSPLLPP
jgi:methylated-DNA-protein-cysteine methyltransferase related protein